VGTQCFKMPIEDVQFMMHNNVPDSVQIFANSAQRNYEHYPTPGHYVVQLDEPIRNVFGIEVLDAAIANTMYNVDIHNCMVRIIMVDTVRSLDLSEATDGLLDKDAADQAELAALERVTLSLGHASELRGWLSDSEWSSFAIAVIDSSAYNTHALPSDTGGAIATSSSQRSYVVVETRRRGVPMHRVASTGEPSASSLPVNGSAWVRFDEAWYSVLGGAVSGPNASVTEVVVGDRFAILPVPASEVAVIRQLSEYVSVAPYSAELFDVVTYNLVPVTQEQFKQYTGVNVVAASIVPYAEATSVCPARLIFSIASAVIEVGAYTSFSDVQGALGTALGNIGAPVLTSGTTDSGIAKQGLLRFTAPPGYRLVISTQDSTAASVIGFDMRASTMISKLPRAIRTYGAVRVGGRKAAMYSGVLQDNVSSRLDSPGMINLLGARYVTLRCPEIEQHLGSTGKYDNKYSTGIGVFKLSSPNEIAQVRSDYVNLVRKPFHPIGRVTRLTLRFEIFGGAMYDFKGINNQMLISIKYYSSPSQQGLLGAGQGPSSSLNPDYDPDFLAFLARRDGYAPRLDDPGNDPYDERDEDEDEGPFVDDDDQFGEDDGYGEDVTGIREAAMRRFGATEQRRIAEAQLEDERWRSREWHR
jgi:hypothetical protein